MVENVECLETELQRLGFSERNALQQRHVVIVDPRTVEETALGVARLSEGLETEQAGVEIGLAVARIVVQREVPGNVLRFVDAIVVDAVGLRSQQGVVAVVEQGHGKTAAEMRDTRNRPTLCPAVRTE